MISVGDKLPDATVLRMGEKGPEQVALGDKIRGRKVVIFGVPGAFSGLCSTAHVPSFMRTKPEFDARGVDEIICLSVNDPWVMHSWGEATGGSNAGLTFLADAGAEFTKAIGADFTAPVVGFYDRSIRYALYAEDGVVKTVQLEEGHGVCNATAGEGLLAAI
ncbi:peroxiredoxin [Primorskyibacter aestuariivivens]|uniref:peroxiredoxin n=1 Tax=Primorskyibacter aestuariivivens TaxID=1888912 RepID=UPI0023019DE4|nr:peroxiredoxin [Primorskyibacter aestuariivivens]MDA7428289.1 peroxiredoxin [Primorskyibacter aestuariivivens]